MEATMVNCNINVTQITILKLNDTKKHKNELENWIGKERKKIINQNSYAPLVVWYPEFRGK